MLFEQLMALADDFDRAFATLSKEELETPLVKGFALARKRLDKLIDYVGLVKMEDQTGKKFDPRIHDAVESVPGKKDTVVEQTLAGYKLNMSKAGNAVTETMVVLSAYFKPKKK